MVAEFSERRSLAKWSAPAGGSRPGLSVVVHEDSARGSCKPNSVVCGHSSRRRVAADAHQRPTRRFHRCMEQPVQALRSAKSRLNASGRCAASPGSQRTLPSLFGLAPCGVYPAPDVTAGAVRSYRTFSPLPLRGAALRTSPQAIPGRPREGGLAEAVSFLWHWPSAGLEAHIPDVIRHTALRSSDFPPPFGSGLPLVLPAATARSSCQSPVYREGRAHRCAGSARNKFIEPKNES